MAGLDPVLYIRNAIMGADARVRRELDVEFRKIQTAIDRLSLLVPLEGLEIPPDLTEEVKALALWDEAHLAAYNPHGKMNWFHKWKAGNYFPSDTGVDGPWLGVANKETSERLSPHPQGEPFWGGEGSVLSQVIGPLASTLLVGFEFTPDQDGYVTGVRWHPDMSLDPNLAYDILVVDNPVDLEPITLYEKLSLQHNGVAEWQILPGVVPILFTVGNVYRVLLRIRNLADTTTTVASYNYRTPKNVNAPDPGQIIQANKLHENLRIHEEDNNQVNRLSLLQSLKEGDSIIRQGLTWTIAGTPVDEGDFWSVPVTPAAQDDGDGISDVTFNVYGSDDLDYVSDAGWYAPYSIIDGLIGATYAGLSATDDLYGIDVEFQNASISADWDLVYVGVGSGGTGGDGGDTGPVDAVDVTYDPTDDPSTGSTNVQNAMIDHGGQIELLVDNLLIHQESFKAKDFIFPTDDGSFTPAAYVVAPANYAAGFYGDFIDFADDQTRQAAILVPCPHQWNNTDFTVRLQWSPSTSASNGQVAQFAISAVVIAEGNFFSSVSPGGTVYLTDNAIGSGGARMHITAESPAINATGGAGPGKSLFLQLQRNPTGGVDTLVGSALVIGLEMLLPAYSPP